MNLADIRSRLQGLEGRAYWRSLEELAGTDEFRQYVTREFPSQASEFNDPAGRRTFLKLMGASLALAGVSACTRQPAEKLVPYVRQPEEVVPGRPLFYATSMTIGGLGMPLLAENHLGRPTKIEGNPEHPASLGAADALAQASVLSLYDPDRSHNVVHRGDVRTWSDFVSAVSAAAANERTTAGAGFRLLTEPVASPSLLDQIQTLLAGMPQARWHQWDPVYGTVQGGAPASHALYRFDRAEIVVSLDSDFLGFGPAAVRYSKDFAARRRISTPEDTPNRLYAVEPVLTITGSNADHRLPLKARDVHAFAAALAAAVGVPGVAGGALPDEARTRWIPAIADDLQAHRGRSVVVAGEHQPAAVHALARTINEALGNVGATVTYAAPVVGSPLDGAASIGELVADIDAGRVRTLVIVSANPVFTAPADLDFRTALQKVPLRVHLGQYFDETAELCHWHAPEAHYLESWGDARAFDGTVSLVQPLIAPLYDGRTALELIAALNGAEVQSSQELVKDYWARAFNGQTKPSWTLRTADGQSYASVDAFWRHALHDGFVASTSTLLAAAPPASVATAPSSAAASTPAPTMTGTEIIFRPDPFILDGRNANNGWLQEMPKPLSKVTWDNVAYMSPATAERLGISVVRHGNREMDLLEVGYGGRRARIPVWIMPGTADDVVVVHFGYGRQRAGRVGSNVGHDVFGLRTSRAPWFDGGAEVASTGDGYLIVSTQNHFVMEGRNPVRVVDTAEFRRNPKAVEEQGPRRPPRTLTLYPPPDQHPHDNHAQHRWGMAIDVNVCTGCSACVVACVAENNIPVVGKMQVDRSREMHWLRVDTYFGGANPQAPDGVYHQPLPCMQCENAPCEVVCPVAATVHSDEGLNDMVYNRCVGTRYCSNNCPYKVRRFNFLLYADFYTEEVKAQRNPDVTIRSRGVMEKCTYCVQRINHARIDAKTAGRPIQDGEIKTACQQTCPADAIVFGDLNDPNSRVVKLKQQERNYGLLEDLGTRPRTTYLARVKNSNPALG
ncbi:MAG: TAT-variant-translocated molybdopterin oxidoreductase [Acidobacteria bacterium]|nr:TAT-variant-translocated molybdopterin oxidoreductase [Acidobacteriota bacterium]